MARILIIIAASIFTLFGIMHGVYTIIDLREPKYFTPRYPAMRQAMQETNIRLHPSINLWKAWMGFNLSHSLSLILFGAPFLYVGIFEPKVFASSPLIQVVAVLVSAIYLILSLKFWFSKPAIGSAIGLVCFLAAIGLAYI